MKLGVSLAQTPSFLSPKSGRCNALIVKLIQKRCGFTKYAYKTSKSFCIRYNKNVEAAERKRP